MRGRPGHNGHVTASQQVWGKGMSRGASVAPEVLLLAGAVLRGQGNYWILESASSDHGETWLLVTIWRWTVGACRNIHRETTEFIVASVT